MNTFQKILIGINALLLVAVVAVLALYVKAKPSDSSSTTPEGLVVNTPELPKAQGKIMYINIDTFQSKYKYFKKIQKELDDLAARNERELKGMQDKLVNTYKKYEKDANLMTDLEMKNAQQDLAGQERSMQEREEKLSMDYAKIAQNKQSEYLDKVKDYMKRKSGEHNYAYVLAYQRESNILYAQDSLDITNLVVEGMNAEYEAAQNK
ncbi:MAG: OmpH family outer membrane protein [Cytophagaceae bacterium]|jgi:outer membrane protein|nr:OmpH family outer membrane protein [Cytophagaceae bacterium]